MSDTFSKDHLAPTSPYPIGLDIEKAEGVYLWDVTGKRYIDMISGIGVSSLGHGNETIKTAIREQLDHHLHVMVYGEFRQKPQVLLADKLTSLLPKSLDCCYFVNSGTEANEAALKLAKRATGRHKIVSFEGAYHGSTHGSLSVSWGDKRKAAFKPLLPNIEFARLNNFSSLDLIDAETACVILETVQGDAGVRIPELEFMTALRDRCHETGALLILDEIQCGLGRTGSFTTFEQFDITPDILTLGKSLGGGMPIGAVVAPIKLISKFSHDPELGHITTFGGHPIACSSALAFLTELERTEVIKDVSNKGELIKSLLEGHPLVNEVRSLGMLMAIELESDKAVSFVVGKCLDMGVIGFYFLSCRNAFRLAPPLIISEDQIREACSVIIKAMDSYSA